MSQEHNETQAQSPSLALRIGIGALLVLAAGALLLLIFSTEPVAERETAVRQNAMLVQVAHAESGTFNPVIETTGVVRPSSEITLTPRISGAVIARSGSFVPGGFVRKGEVVVKIDDADYLNALRQRESELKQAIAQLEIEKGRQELAERDYRELQGTISDDNRALILREPQQRAAEAIVLAAQAAVSQARLDLERTAVKAPFDAQVLSREVNVGSQVTAGDGLGRLAGTDEYWVEITVPLDRLRWLEFAAGESDRGSPVVIRHRTAWEPDQARQGYLYHLIGELEGNTRLARALVSVPDPLAHDDASGNTPPLMIGTFVECRIRGRAINDVVRMPRDYLRANSTVWLMRDGALAIQPVTILLEDAEYAYISEGLSANDLVVTTNLSTVKEGTPLRVEDRTP